MNLPLADARMLRRQLFLGPRFCMIAYRAGVHIVGNANLFFLWLMACSHLLLTS